jgi:hypothetical protein
MSRAHIRTERSFHWLDKPRLLILTALLLSSPALCDEFSDKLDRTIAEHFCPNPPSTYADVTYEDHCGGKNFEDRLGVAAALRCEYEVDHINKSIWKYNDFVQKCRDSERMRKERNANADLRARLDDLKARAGQHPDPARRLYDTKLQTLDDVQQSQMKDLDSARRDTNPESPDDDEDEQPKPTRPRVKAPPARSAQRPSPQVPPVKNCNRPKSGSSGGLGSASQALNSC